MELGNLATGINERALRCARGRRRPFSMALSWTTNDKLRTALHSSINVRRCAPGELAQHLPRGGGDPPESQRRPEPHAGNRLPRQWIVLVLVDGRRWHVGTVQMTTRYEVHHPTESVWTAARSRSAGMSRTAGCNPSRSIQRAFRALIARHLPSSCSWSTPYQNPSPARAPSHWPRRLQARLDGADHTAWPMSVRVTSRGAKWTLVRRPLRARVSWPGGGKRQRRTLVPWDG